MATTRIVTVTPNPALDRATSTDHVQPGPKLRCLAPRIDPGGGGINVARAIRILGGHATAVTALGGPIGEQVRRLLVSSGLDVRAVPIHGETRESLTVDDAATGGQYRFVLPGPTLDKGEQDELLTTAAAATGPGEWCVGSGSLPSGTRATFWADLASELATEGARLVLDSGGEAARRALDVGVGVFRLNDLEKAELVGHELVGRADQEKACRDLVERGGAEIVVMGLGPQGSLVVSAEESKLVPAPKVVRRSAVGAGDSLVAGLTLGLARGWSLSDAAAYGVAAGSAAHLTPGTELCRPEDVDRLFEAITGYPPASVGGDAGG